MNQPEEWGYEAKFCVRTDFLDTTFRRSRQQREGESYEDYCVEMHREMLGVIDRLRKEFGPNVEYTPIYPGGTIDKPNTIGPVPINVIDKSVEKLEIAIDNAPDLQALAALKEEASKHGLVSLYMERLKQLTNA